MAHRMPGAGDDDLAHFKAGRHRPRVQRSGTAEGDQGKLPGIRNLFDGDGAYGPAHVGGDDLEDTKGGALDGETQFFGDRSQNLALASESRPMAPSRSPRGDRRPRTRLASVTVALSPPVP